MDSNKQIAAGLTFLAGVAIILWLMLTNLMWHGKGTWPPEPDPYVEMEAYEYSEEIDLTMPPDKVPGRDDAPALSDADADNRAEAAPLSGSDIKNTGAKAEETPVLATQTKTSEVKVESKKTEKPAGTTVDKAKEEAEKSAAITKNTQNIFKKSDAKDEATGHGKADGPAGRKTGQKDSAGKKGTTRGTASVYGGGWAAPNYNTDHIGGFDKDGTVTFKLQFGADGKVDPATVKVIANSAQYPQNIVDALHKLVVDGRFTRTGSNTVNPDGSTAEVRFTLKVTN